MGIHPQINRLQQVFEAFRQRRGLSGRVLKILAMAFMFIDHCGAALIRPLYLSTRSHELFLFYRSCRYIGRIAFPIFCFFIAEGFYHVKDDPARLKRYLGRLFLFAVLSEIPFDLALKGGVFVWSSQNVYWTLLLGVLALCISEKLHNVIRRPIFRLLSTILIVTLIACFAQFVHTDYRWIGVVCIVVFYLFRNERLAAGLGTTGVLMYSSSMEIAALAATPLLLLYNGKRGRQNKWLFYGFYPAHLLLLWFIKTCFI